MRTAPLRERKYRDLGATFVTRLRRKGSRENSPYTKPVEKQHIPCAARVLWEDALIETQFKTH